MSYKYVTENNLENRQDYKYSNYEGWGFLENYTESRKALSQRINMENTLDEHSTKSRLMRLKKNLFANEIAEADKKLADDFVKIFEVRKRLHTRYTENGFKPENDSDYSDINNYILFAQILILMYYHTSCLKYVSCLLKVDDTLLSQAGCMQEHEKRSLDDIINVEMSIVENISVHTGLRRFVDDNL